MSEFSAYWQDMASLEDIAFKVSRSLVDRLDDIGNTELLEQATALSGSIEATIPTPEEKFIKANSRRPVEALTAPDWHAAYLACESLFMLYYNKLDVHHHPIQAGSFGVVLLDQPTAEGDVSPSGFATLRSHNGISLSRSELELIMSGDYADDDRFFATGPDGTRLDTLAGMNFALYQNLGVVDRYYEAYATEETDFFTYTLLMGENRDEDETGYPVAFNHGEDNPTKTFVKSPEHVGIRPVLPIAAFMDAE